MLLDVTHSTEMLYHPAISETVMELRLRPLDDDTQRCLEFDLQIDPSGHVAVTKDSFGNAVHHFNYRPAHRRILAVSHSVVETGLGNSVRSPDLFRYQFLGFDGPVLLLPTIEQLVSSLRPTRADDPVEVEATLGKLTTLVNQRFRYKKGVTTTKSTVADLESIGAGVCQDFAHYWIAVSRAMRIPARYVSGYIHHQPGDDIFVGATGASHAWGEGWIPGRGWCGFDPTNPVTVGDHHVKLAVGRDYRDVPPTKGIFDGPASETISVNVETRRLDRLPPGAASRLSAAT
jgi:transglutaminase-like putative cysteine protease